MAFSIASRKSSQLAKKSVGIAFIFLGCFFCIIGFLFSFLFELYGFLIMAGFGILFIVISIVLLRSTRDIRLFDVSSYRHSSLIPIKSQKQCTKCFRIIPLDALLCPYCGYRIESNRETSIGFQPQQPICPSCGGKIEPGIKYCSYCGTEQK